MICSCEVTPTSRHRSCTCPPLSLAPPHTRTHTHALPGSPPCNRPLTLHPFPSKPQSRCWLGSTSARGAVQRGSRNCARGCGGRWVGAGQQSDYGGHRKGCWGEGNAEEVAQLRQTLWGQTGWWVLGGKAGLQDGGCRKRDVLISHPLYQHALITPPHYHRSGLRRTHICIAAASLASPAAQQKQHKQ